MDSPNRGTQKHASHLSSSYSEDDFQVLSASAKSLAVRFMPLVDNPTIMYLRLMNIFS